MKLYQAVARALEAYANCTRATPPNIEWADRHLARIRELTNAHFPHGSGIDAGSELDPSASKPDRLVWVTSYHHMNEHGSYDGWTDHKVIVTPSLARGFDLRITGRNRNEIHEYLYEVFGDALNADAIEFAGVTLADAMAGES